MWGSFLQADLLGVIEHTSTISLFAVVLILILILRLSSLIWVLKDSMARSRSVWFHIFAVLLVTFLTPIVGLPVYYALRPLFLLPHRYYGAVLTQALTIPCHQCRTPVAYDHYFCHVCGTDCTKKCQHCGTYYPYTYVHCFHCGTKENTSKVD